MKERILARPLFCWAWVCLAGLALLLLLPGALWVLGAAAAVSAAGLTRPSVRKIAFLTGTAVIASVIVLLLWEMRSAPVMAAAGTEARMEGVVLNVERWDNAARYEFYGSCPQLGGRKILLPVVSFRSLDLEPGDEAAGMVSLALPREENLRYHYSQGYLLEGEGELEAADTGWADTFRGRIALLRRRMKEILDQSFSPSTAALAHALILSDDAAIDPPLLEGMRQSGTAHLLVVSGYHVALLLGGLTAVFRFLRCRPWISMPISLAVLAGFCALVGFTPSAVRASIMGAACLAAQAMGRENDSLTALALAALAILFANPWRLFSWSFLLSFSATLSVVVFAGPILDGMTARARGARRPVPRVVKAAGKVIGISLAAAVLCFPVQAVMFGWVPVLSPIANLLIAPFVPMLFFLGGAAVLLGLAGLPFPAFAAAAGELSAWMIRGCTHLMVAAPGVSLPVNEWWIVLWLAASAGILLLARAIALPRRQVRWLVLLVVPLLCGLLLDGAQAGERVTLLTPEGQGSVLVERGGKGMVILDGWEGAEGLEAMAELVERSGVEEVQLLVCAPGTRAELTAEACRLLSPKGILIPRESLSRDGLRLPDSVWTGALEESRAELLGGVVCPVELGEGTITLEIGGAKVLKLLGGYDIIKDKSLLEGANLIVSPGGRIFSPDRNLTVRTLAAGQRQVKIRME